MIRITRDGRVGWYNPRTMPEDLLRKWAEENAPKLDELAGELSMLHDALGEHPKDGIPWAIFKVHRQRKALDALTARNTRLRFQLRNIEKLGRGLTREEFLTAKKAELEERAEKEREMLSERIGEPATVSG